MLDIIKEVVGSRLNKHGMALLQGYCLNTPGLMQKLNFIQEQPSEAEYPKVLGGNIL